MTTTTTTTITTATNNKGKGNHQHQPLLTPTSTALSLSPPRIPPHGSILRSLYTHPAASWRYLLHPQNRHHAHVHHAPSVRHDAVNISASINNKNAHHFNNLSSRLLHLLLTKKTASSSSSYSIFQASPPFLHHLHHPHLPTSLSLPDQMTRYLSAILPLHVQHTFRDNGYFQLVADSLVTATCPLMGLGHWKEVREFVELSHVLKEEDDGDVAQSTLQGGGDKANDTKPAAADENVMNDNNLIDGADDHAQDNSRARREATAMKSRRRKWTRRRIPYGEHSMQFIDLFLPSIPMNEESKNGDDVVEPPSSTNPVDDFTNYSDYSTKQQNKIPVRGTIFFVHGGAWGSGKPWMYRLIAPTFLKLHFAVVIVGYRTYPDAATIGDQVGDILLAWEKAGDVLNNSVTMMSSSATSQCESTRGDACDNDDAGSNICTDDASNGWVGNVIMGHSSGAHVAMLMLVLWIQKQQRQWKNHPGAPNHSRNASGSNYPWDPNYFIGLSGPYDINDHFDYEAGRGVEQISPMKPICGHSREKFHKASPVKRFLSLFREQCDDDSELHNHARSIQQLTPPILLVHGIEDATVPFTATADAGRILRSCGLQRCDEIYLDETGHQDVIVHFMFGGLAKDLVLDWLFDCYRGRRDRGSSKLQSRL